MPEGDTVHRAARLLDRSLSGHRLVVCDLRVPQLASVDLRGREVLATVPRGKHLLTRLGPRPDLAGTSGRSQDGTASGAAARSGPPVAGAGAGGGHDPGPPGPVTLHSHLKMEGVWHVGAVGSRWRRPGHLLRARLAVGDDGHGGPTTEALGFELGVLDLLLTEDEHRVVGHLGPDLLDPAADLDEAVRRLREGPERLARGLGEALLDQRCLAGIGNVYKSEVCFVSGLHPETPVGAVDPERLRRVVALAQRMLEANKDRPERTTTGQAVRGRRLWVYGRRRERCSRCGTPVQRALHGSPPDERSTYWCPTCQPLPRPR